MVAACSWNLISDQPIENKYTVWTCRCSHLHADHWFIEKCESWMELHTDVDTCTTLMNLRKIDMLAYKIIHLITVNTHTHTHRVVKINSNMKNKTYA